MSNNCKRPSEKKKSTFFADSIAEMRKDKKLVFVYALLQVLVALTLVAQAFNHNYYNVFTCVLTLALFWIPSVVEQKLHIEMPNTLEIIVLLFIFSAEILGEIQEYYLIYKHWDTMLHTLNGFLMAAIGFSMIDILNRSEKFSISMSPVFVAMVSFCFSMTIGVLWEFFEFFMDRMFLMDMQKDTYITAVSSVLLNPAGRNVAVTEYIRDVVINGQRWPGYIDIGLMDTMNDLFVNFIGAVVFSIFGLFYIKYRGKRNKFIYEIVPVRMEGGKKRGEKERERE